MNHKKHQQRARQRARQTVAALEQRLDRLSDLLSFANSQRDRALLALREADRHRYPLPVEMMTERLMARFQHETTKRLYAQRDSLWEEMGALALDALRAPVPHQVHIGVGNVPPEIEFAREHSPSPGERSPGWVVRLHLPALSLNYVLRDEDAQAMGAHEAKGRARKDREVSQRSP